MGSSVRRLAGRALLCGRGSMQTLPLRSRKRRLKGGNAAGIRTTFLASFIVTGSIPKRRNTKYANWCYFEQQSMIVLSS